LYDEELRYFVRFYKHHYWNQLKAEGADAVAAQFAGTSNAHRTQNLI
jgi:hypothetical protein